MKTETRMQIRGCFITPGSEEIRREGINAVVYVSRNDGHISAAGYRGTAGKPSFNYLFRTEENMLKYIEEFFASVKVRQDYMADRARKRQEYVPGLKPGDLLHTCWGYDQTNVEFFQVLRVSGKTVTLREVCQDYTETGWLRGRTKPRPGEFLKDAPEIRRRVLEGDTIRIDNVRYAWKYEGGDCYTSSYA